MRTHPASFILPLDEVCSSPKVAAPHQQVCWYLHVIMELPKRGFCWGNKRKTSMKMLTECSIFHQEISSGFLKLGRIDLPCSHLTAQVFHGGDGQEDAGAAQGTQQGSNGARDGQNVPKTWPKTGSTWSGFCYPLGSSGSHMSPCASQSHQSHSHPCAASVSPPME